MGSRVLAVLPPKDGYGSEGNSQIGITGRHPRVRRGHHQGLRATASAYGSQVSSGGGALPTVTAKTGTAPVVTIPTSNRRPSSWSRP